MAKVPVIASGGLGSTSDLVQVVQDCGVDAVAIASMLHYNKLTLNNFRSESEKNNIPVRPYE